MVDLKHCPFCGGTELDYQRGTKDREGTPTAVMCSECGAVGPWVYIPDGKDYHEADVAWNERNG